jgi:hypothetical protein
MNVKIGSSTATEPMRTQGGTPVQNFLCFSRVNMLSGIYVFQIFYLSPAAGRFPSDSTGADQLDTKYSMYPCK